MRISHILNKHVRTDVSTAITYDGTHSTDEAQLTELRASLDKAMQQRAIAEELLEKERREHALASFNRSFSSHPCRLTTPASLCRSNRGESIDMWKARVLKLREELARTQRERDALREHCV